VIGRTETGRPPYLSAPWRMGADSGRAGLVQKTRDRVVSERPAPRARRGGGVEVLLLAFLRTHRTHSPIGVDVGDRTIRAVQFRRRGQRTELHAARSRQMPRSEDGSQDGAAGALETLRSVIGDGPFVGAEIVSAVPSRDVDIRPLRLPAGVSRENDEEFEEALLLSARSSLLYNIEEAVVDYLPLGAEREESEERLAVLLVAAKKRDVNRLLALFKGAGLRCLHLDARPCASARVLCEDGGAFAMIELGPTCATFSVARESDLLFSRTVSLGTDGIIEELVRTLSINRQEAEQMLTTYGISYARPSRCDLRKAEETGLVDADLFPRLNFDVAKPVLDRIVAEAKRSINYFSRQRRGGSVEKAFLWGDLMPANVDGCLAQALSIPVVIADPFARVCGEILSGFNGDSSGRSAFCVASGLALRAWTS